MRAALLLTIAALVGVWAVLLADSERKTAHAQGWATLVTHSETFVAHPPRREAFPPRARVRAARQYVASRRGDVAFALIDSHGHAYGFAPNRLYVSASVVKAMLLVAYLRAIGPRAPSRAERAALSPMIERSSNKAATAIYRRVGDGGLWVLARRARMTHFSVAGYWASAQITASDQARFFRRVDRLVPRQSRPYARRLLSSIVPWQRWGFSRYARRAGFTTFFKGGWRPTGSGRLVHEAALFERDGKRFSMVVLSDGNPTHEYGTATLRGVARRIFGPTGEAGATEAGSPAHRRAGLVDVYRYAPGIALDVRYATKHNLTGHPLPGYCRPWALLRDRPARDLARVQRHLRRRDLGLKIFDAYRPRRATRALVAWARRSGRPELIGTYIAKRSRHNQGIAVDLTLTKNGRPLPMGTAYDDLTPRSHTLNAKGQALRNRLTLRRAMQRFRFKPYAREWWHFEHRRASGPPLDIPLGCRTR